MDGLISYEIDETNETTNYTDEIKPYMLYIVPGLFIILLLVSLYKLFRACKPKQHRFAVPKQM